MRSVRTPCTCRMRPGEAADEDLKAVYEQAFKQVDGKPFAHANLSWITADQVYLARVTPSPETINDSRPTSSSPGTIPPESRSGRDDFAKIKPLLEWNNHMGCVTATWVPGLKKYLMCVTDGWPTVAKMDSYILEADTITGPWRIVSLHEGLRRAGLLPELPEQVHQRGRPHALAVLLGELQLAAGTAWT